MSPEPISIALVGGGLIGPRHAEHIISSPDCHFSAFVDPSPKGPAQAEAWGVPYFSSVTEMLKSHVPNAALVATPNHTHVPITSELVRAGVNVLVEKPVSTSIPDGKALLSLCQTQGTKGPKVLVGHHRRFNPYVIAAKSALASNTLGDVTALSGLWCLKKPASYFDPPTEWRREEKSGGGPVLTNFIHDVDVLQHLLGPVSSVYAVPLLKRRNYEVTEGCAMTLTFESGVVGTFISADNIASPNNFESGTGENPMIPREGKDFLRIFGTEGTLSLPEGLWKDNGGWTEKLSWENLQVTTEKPFDLQLKHFVNVVRGEEEPSCSVEEALRAVVVCDAIGRSVKQNMPVKIEI